MRCPLLSLLPLLLACRPTPEPGPDTGDAPSPWFPTEGPSRPASPPCRALGTSSIVEASASQPWHENELLLAATTDVPATLAAICRLDGDDVEAHLVEESTPSTSHSLRIAGLIAESDYTCQLFPTCPGSTAAPTEIPVHTGPGPDDLPAVEVEGPSEVGDAYVLTNWVQADDYSTGLLLIYDRQGRVRWWYRTPANVGPSLCFEHVGGESLTWGGGWPPVADGRPRLLNLFDGEIWDSAEVLTDAELSKFHHDGKRLDDGRWVSLEQVSVNSGGTEFYGFQARILNPETGETELTYSAQRPIDEGHLEPGIGDAWHTNWVDVVPDGQGESLLLSLRNVSLLIAADAATGDWRWAFGAGGDFTLLDSEGQPLGDEGYPSFLHAPELHDDVLYLYDNGVSAERSRVVAYRLDTDAMTATLLWTWTEPSWYERYLGSVNLLPNGHVLIGRGHGEPYSPSPGDMSTILEIDPETGDKLWQLTWPEVYAQLYRASWADPCDLFADAGTCEAVRVRVDMLEQRD